MENVITAGLSAALDTKVVIGGKDGTDLPLDNAHMHTCTWQIHKEGNQQQTAVANQNQTTVTNQPRMLIYVKNLTGKTNPIEVEPSFTIRDVKSKLQMQEGVPVNQQKLIYGRDNLEDDRTLTEYKIRTESTLHLILRRKDNLKINGNAFAPQFNFTYPQAGNIENFTRGSRKFDRPLGWVKYAITVLGKYENDAWLGHTNQPGEWPVSYHGTDKMCSESVSTNVVEVQRGKNFKYGRGMYSVPTADAAERYATPFTFQGVKYKMIFMNRVNPAYTREVREPAIGTYFITSDETQMRAYAMLVKQVNN